jgi:hypothetical protein
MIWIWVMIIVIVLMYSNQNNFQNLGNEHFSQISMVPAFWMDNTYRHLRFSNAGGIIYTSNSPPSESDNCKMFNCPEEIDHLATLGDNNICWRC